MGVYSSATEVILEWRNSESKFGGASLRYITVCLHGLEQYASKLNGSSELQSQRQSLYSLEERNSFFVPTEPVKFKSGSRLIGGDRSTALYPRDDTFQHSKGSRSLHSTR